MRASTLATLAAWTAVALTSALWPNSIGLAASVAVTLGCTLLTFAHFIALIARVATVHRAVSRELGVGRREALFTFGRVALGATILGFGLFRMPRAAQAWPTPTPTSSPPPVECEGKHFLNFTIHRPDGAAIDVCATKPGSAAEVFKALLLLAKGPGIRGEDPRVPQLRASLMQAKQAAEAICQPFSTRVCLMCRFDAFLFGDVNCAADTPPTRCATGVVFHCQIIAENVICNCKR